MIILDFKFTFSIQKIPFEVNFDISQIFKNIFDTHLFLEFFRTILIELIKFFIIWNGLRRFFWKEAWTAVREKENLESFECAELYFVVGGQLLHNHLLSTSFSLCILSQLRMFNFHHFRPFVVFLLLLFKQFIIFRLHNEKSLHGFEDEAIFWKWT